MYFSTESYEISSWIFHIFLFLFPLTVPRSSKLSNKPTCIIVGPEGDFSEAEREQILNFDGVQALKINDNILRSETAVISTISIVNYAIN